MGYLYCNRGGGSYERLDGLSAETFFYLILLLYSFDLDNFPFLNIIKRNQECIHGGK